jgi:uncharacterized protein (DUF1501 family)
MNKSNILTRREFLQRGVVLAATSFTVPSFLLRTVNAFDNPKDQRRTASIPGMPDDRILVVLQLGGGNDGINTVVPFGDDNYYRLRKTLAIAADGTLKLNDSVGLHPSMAKLKSLFDDGRVAVVQGVGYPNPNRSHFRGTEIWATASDANVVEKHGWLGRYFDAQCPGCGEKHPELAVHIGRIPPEAFKSSQPIGIALENPDALELKPATKDAMQAQEEKKIFRELNKPKNSNGGAGVSPADQLKSTGGTPAPPSRESVSPLDYVQRTSMNAQLASERVKDAIRHYKGTVEYPQSGLARRLQLIAQMIAGNMPTRVYYASLGGFDTHANQKQSHANLLTEFSTAVEAFHRDLKEQGNDGRVVMMTFSEFGRRAAENASGGTDHGAAAPMFVIGTPVKGGLYSKYPSLADLDRGGDIKMTADFRSVYATILENWLKVKSQPILRQNFEKLAFLG